MLDAAAEEEEEGELEGEEEGGGWEEEEAGDEVAGGGADEMAGAALEQFPGATLDQLLGDADGEAAGDDGEAAGGACGAYTPLCPRLSLASASPAEELRSAAQGGRHELEVALRSSRSQLRDAEEELFQRTESLRVLGYQDFGVG